MILTQSEIVENIKGDVVDEFKDIKESEIETFTENVVREMGIEASLVPIHSQGIIIIR